MSENVREKVARIVRQRVETSPSYAVINCWTVAGEILSIPEIADAARRIEELKAEIAELERTVEAWQYAAQYPDG